MSSHRLGRRESGEQGLECHLVGADKRDCLRRKQQRFEEPVVRLRHGGRWVLKIAEAPKARTESTVARNRARSTWCTHGVSTDAHSS